MKWIELLEWLNQIKASYEKEWEDNPLSPLYIQEDENYPSKYQVIFSLAYEIDNVEDDWIYEQMVFVDINEEYDYKNTFNVYIRAKSNWNPLDVYYMKIINWIERDNNDFIIDFLNSLLYINH